MAHVLAKDLREAVLQAAIQGRLTEHLESDTPIEVTLKEIDEVKKQLIKEKKIKKEKLLSKITDDEIPFEAPDCWAKTRLQDCFYIHSAMRIHQSDWVKEGIPFLRGRELVKLAKTGRIESDVHITNELFQHLKTKGGVPQKNDILISAVGTLGKVYVVKGDEVFYYKDAYILCLDNYKLNPKFIKYLLESPYIQQLIYSDDAFGTTVAQLTISKMKNMPIILPPIEEQARIVAKVDEIMAKIDEYEKLENQLVKLKEQFPQDMKDSLLQAGMIGELTNCQPNSTESYSNVFEISGGSQPSKSYFVEAPQEGYVQLYQIRDYGNKPIPVYIPDKFATKKTKEGDILLARYGGSLGKVFIAHDGAYNVAMAKVIQINPGTFLNRFVYYYHLSSEYQDFCRKVSNGRSAQAGFNKDDIATLSVNIFSIEEQQRIVDKLDELLPLVDKLAELN